MYSLWKLVILNRQQKGRTARAHKRQRMFHSSTLPRSALSCQLFGLSKLRSLRDEVHLKYLADTGHNLAASPATYEYIPSHTLTHTHIHSSVCPSIFVRSSSGNCYKFYLFIHNLLLFVFMWISLMPRALVCGCVCVWVCGCPSWIMNGIRVLDHLIT